MICLSTVICCFRVNSASAELPALRDQVHHLKARNVLLSGRLGLISSKACLLQEQQGAVKDRQLKLKTLFHMEIGAMRDLLVHFRTLVSEKTAMTDQRVDVRAAALKNDLVIASATILDLRQRLLDTEHERESLKQAVESMQTDLFAFRQQDAVSVSRVQHEQDIQDLQEMVLRHRLEAEDVRLSGSQMAKENLVLQRHIEDMLVTLRAQKRALLEAEVHIKAGMQARMQLELIAVEAERRTSALEEALAALRSRDLEELKTLRGVLEDTQARLGRREDELTTLRLTVEGLLTTPAKDQAASSIAVKPRRVDFTGLPSRLALSPKDQAAATDADALMKGDVESFIAAVGGGMSLSLMPSCHVLVFVLRALLRLQRRVIRRKQTIQEACEKQRARDGRRAQSYEGKLGDVVQRLRGDRDLCRTRLVGAAEKLRRHRLLAKCFVRLCVTGRVRFRPTPEPGTP